MKRLTRCWKCAVAMAAMVALPLTTQGVRSVDWPSNYETQIATHVAETTPSGGHVGTSPAYIGFDSVLEIVAFAFFTELRNAPVPGLIITIQ